MNTDWTGSVVWHLKKELDKCVITLVDNDETKRTSITNKAKLLLTTGDPSTSTSNGAMHHNYYPLRLVGQVDTHATAVYVTVT
jgi:hypothetical protein